MKLEASIKPVDNDRNIYLRALTEEHVTQTYIDLNDQKLFSSGAEIYKKQPAFDATVCSKKHYVRGRVDACYTHRKDTYRQYQNRPNK